MGIIGGERIAEIAAPIERCYEIAADLERAPEWQRALKDVEVLERGPDGRATLVATESDAGVKTVSARLRFSYDPPGAIRWVQEKGDMKSLDGAWLLEDLGGGRTRATYTLAADPGRVLGMLLRGPVEAKVRDSLIGSALDGLKQRAEDARPV